MQETVVLLHGFSGTRRTFDGVLELLDPERYRGLALDLPGHGDLAGTPARDFTAAAASVLGRSPERFLLGGYSLGGRLALQIALLAPERVGGLLLISTAAGIEDAGTRAERTVADERLAQQLESGSFEDFIERWRGQPLFAADPPAVAERAKADQRRNDPRALAASLRSLGAGAMEPLWSRLGELSMPTTVLAGERDAKYIAEGRRLAGAIRSSHFEVAPGGHALALECPQAVASAIEGLAARAAVREPG